MESLYSYLKQLYKKQKLSATNHRRETPVRSLSDNMQLTHLPVSQEYHPQLDQLVQDMSFEKEYSCKFINDYTPDDPVKRFRFIQCLKNGITIPCMLFCIRQGVILETSIICGKFYQMMTISSREVNKWLN